jgi:hypothetical protein
MKKVVALIVSLMLLFAFTIGCKPAEKPKPETPAETPAPVSEIPAEVPAPETPAGPPDVVVVPSGTSYVYMVPDTIGLYFYHGYWYLFHNRYWYRSTMYSGPWNYIETSIVPLVVVNIPPDYIYHIPSGYHRIHYRDLFRNWLTWDHSRYWNKYDWYKHEWQRYTNRYKPQGSGFKQQGSGFKQQGSGFKQQGSGFKQQGSGFKQQGSGFKQQGSGFKQQGSQKTRQQQGQNPQQQR